MTHPDPAVAYAALRAETAEMFSYDLTNLSLTQGLQLELVSLLRLEVDTMSGQVLAGETVDLQRLSTAHNLLRQMLPPSSLVAPAPAPEERGDSAAFNQIAEQIDRQLEQLERQMARDPDRARREFEQKLQTAIAKHKPNEQGANGTLIPARCEPPILISPDAPRVDVSLAVVSPAAAERSSADDVSRPALPAAPAAPPAPPKMSIDQINDPARAPIPSSYLKGPPEPWRAFSHWFI